MCIGAFKTSGDAQWTTGWTAPSSDFGVDCVIKKPLADLVVQLVEVQRAWTIFGTAPTALDHTGGPFTITVAPWFTSVRLSNTTKTELFVGDVSIHASPLYRRLRRLRHCGLC